MCVNTCIHDNALQISCSLQIFFVLCEQWVLETCAIAKMWLCRFFASGIIGFCYAKQMLLLPP